MPVRYKKLTDRRARVVCKRQGCAGKVGPKTLAVLADGAMTLLDVCVVCGKEYGAPYFVPAPRRPNA